MEKYSLAMLVHMVQSYDRERSKAAMAEIERRGFTYDELHDEFED